MTGILGGSFDPPHLGHMRLAEAARDELGLEKIILIPAGTPPHKRLSGGAGERDRLEMTRIAAEGRDWISVSGIELERSGKSYSFDTVSELKKRFPEEKFCFICGTDMLLSLDRWYRSDELMKLCAFAAMARNDGDLVKIEKKAQELRKLGAEIFVIRRAPIVTSSSEFRSTLSPDELDPGVYEYIRRKGLYGVEKA
ncbi:MAG: nicotinate (nicotinamide) nucleotide adenylyltransferase [Eubacteriales bacterium]